MTTAQGENFLPSFMLGNVDNQGRLVPEDLNPAVREQLTSVASLPNAGGIADDQLTDFDETKESSAPSEGDETVRPAADAYDYSGEVEQIQLSAEAAIGLAHATFSGEAPTAMDEDENYDEAAPRAEVTVQDALAAIERAAVPGEAPVSQRTLRFTELFSAHTQPPPALPMRRQSPVKRAKRPLSQVAPDDFDRFISPDSQEVAPEHQPVFSQWEAIAIKPIEHSSSEMDLASAAPSSRNGDGPGQRLRPLRAEELAGRPGLEPHMFTLVEQQSWDTAIAWGEEPAPSKADTISERKDMFKPVPLPVYPSNKRPRWGELQTVARPDPPAAREQRVPSTVGCSIDGFNPDLHDDAWLDKVHWEDRPAAVDAPLIMDLTDPHMSFSLRNPVAAPAPKPEGPVYSFSLKKCKTRVLPVEGFALPGKVQRVKDRFNLSNEKEAKAKKEEKKVTEAAAPSASSKLLKHSDYAMRLQGVTADLKKEDLQNFHKPKLCVWKLLEEKDRSRPLLKSYDIGSHESGTSELKFKFKASKSAKTTQMREGRDLSGQDGKIVLIEYIEPRPVLIANVGMGYRLPCYCCKPGHTKDMEFNPPTEPLADGEYLPYNPEKDPRPLLHDMAPGEVVQVLRQNMSRAPIFKHQMPSTDFLVVVPRGKKSRAYLREVSVYTAGAVEPLRPVHPPGSRGGNDFKNKRIQAHIYRLFTTIRKDGAIPRVRISEVLHEFHSHSETSIRKRLKECSDFQRGGNDSGWWTVKEGFKYPSEKDLMKMVEPESLCSFEAMQAGQQALVDLGIDRLISTKEVGGALSRMGDEEQLQTIGEFILSRLSMAPWTRTYGHSQARAIPQPQLPFAELRQIAVRTNDSFSLEVPRPLYESSDLSVMNLHKVKNTEIGTKLHHLKGVSEEEVQKSSRFDRLALFRRINYWEHHRDKESMLRTAKSKDRENRWTLAKQAEMHRFEMEKAYKCQDEKLSAANPEFSSDDESDEQEDEVDYDDLINNIEEDFEAENKISKKRRKLELAPNAEQLQLSELINSTAEQNSGPVEAPTLLESARPPVPKTGGAKQIKNGKRIRIMLLKKMIKADARGQLTTIYDWIRDPREIDKQLKRDAKTRAARTQMTAEEHNKMTDDRREKRRLQEMKRRLERRQKVEANGGYPSRSNRPGGAGPSRARESQCTSRCSACGEMGHMRTNRKCPKYSMSEQDQREGFADDGMEISGTQIRLTAGKMSEAKAKVDEAANPTLKIDMTRVSKAEKKKRRREEQEFGAVEYAPPTKQTHRGRRMAKNPEIVLANLLEEIYLKVSGSRDAEVFLRPVDTKLYGNYLSVIAPNKPMDLKTIRDKIRDHLYRSSQGLVDDIKLMVQNCEKFNGAISLYARQGHSLIELCLEELEKVDSDIQDVERRLLGENNTSSGTGRTPIGPPSTSMGAPSRSGSAAAPAALSGSMGEL